MIQNSKVAKSLTYIALYLLGYTLNKNMNITHIKKNVVISSFILLITAFEAILAPWDLWGSSRGHLCLLQKLYLFQ